METVFIVLGVILFLQSLLSFGAALRFARYALRYNRPRSTRYQPKAVIIVPCKGLEHDFEENIRALFAQEYRDYEIIFVTENERDPAYGVLSKLIKSYSRRPAWLIVANEAKACGQKVHNLLAAIDMLNSIDRRAEVLVFADSDARTSRHWLSELVAPLGESPDRVVLTPRYAWQLRVGGAQSGVLNLELGRDGAEAVEKRLARFVAAYPESLGRLPRRAAADNAFVDLRYPNGFALRVAGWKG